MPADPAGALAAAGRTAGCPGVLEWGALPVLFRLGAIMGIASGILLQRLFLTITAAVALSNATNGRATYSEEQSQATG